ncbi:proteasome assembly chaperone 4 isoform X1 [Chroicocephalus ridibundus]|uniref:proteasome assembly chaperone 4 isoform X1 n=1 Tax=Chroicocephalus ridibundus TaxID=1192867 RepID=UPI002FDD324B
MEAAAAGGGGAAAGGGGGIALHDFIGRLGEQLVHFHAMRLRDSLFLWVGAAPALASLAVAMCTPRDSIPVAASLLGDPSDTASACLAQRLGPGPYTHMHPILRHSSCSRGLSPLGDPNTEASPQAFLWDRPFPSPSPARPRSPASGVSPSGDSF